MLLSNITEWVVEIQGHHVQAVDVFTPSLAKRQKISESVKDSMMLAKEHGMKPFDIFRKQLAPHVNENLEASFKDSRNCPTSSRMVNFMKNVQKRHSFQSGQWSAVHSIIPQIEESGKLLLHQKDNRDAATGDIDSSYVLTLSNKTALESARQNAHVLGIDGKHGLQDDGACLQTSTTQHKDGFGCPTAFTIMNRENTDTIYLALRSITENVPCSDQHCQHPVEYFNLPGGKGVRRHTPCATAEPYRPLVMIDKHEPSSIACERLNLPYILCWFHIVKALTKAEIH